MAKIIIVGAGSMGSAFTVPCVENKNDTVLVGTHLENDLIEKLKKDYFHPTIKTKLPKELKFEKFENLEKVIDDVDAIVVGVSSVGIEWFANEISKFYKNETPIILLTKGLAIVEGKLITLSEKIKKILSKKNHQKIDISAIKGPCLATGLANKMRTGTVIANSNLKSAEYLKKLISTNYYSTEISQDIAGVELSGAIKNIYSMLIGASEGLSNPKAPKEIQEKFFLNTSASLIHRSISEMVKFVERYGGKASTVYGLAGLGDLYVSAIGGRNSLMGKYLGQGHLYKDAKEKFMKNITIEGAELANEIGSLIMKELNNKDFPLMFNLLNCLCNNKKLEINW